MSQTESSMRNKIGNYTILGFIGKGSFGTIYRVCSLEDNNIYAMKEIPFEDGYEMDKAYQER